MATQTKDFKQGRDMEIYKLGGVAGSGICMSLCVYYLVERSKGNDFWEWLGHVANKALAINSQGGGQSVAEYQQYLNQVIQSELRATWGGQGNIDTLGSAFLKADARIGGVTELGTYKMAVIESSRFGRLHALAVQRRPEIRLMDPNYGEYEFASVLDFKNWVSSHCATHYQAHDRYTMYAYASY